MAQQVQCPNCGSYDMIPLDGDVFGALEFVVAIIGLFTLGFSGYVTEPIRRDIWKRNWESDSASATCRLCKFRFTLNDYPQVKARREMWQLAAEDEERRRREQVLQPKSQAPLSQTANSSPQTKPVEIKKCRRCGADNLQQNKFCGDCGAPLLLPPAKT